MLSGMTEGASVRCVFLVGVHQCHDRDRGARPTRVLVHNLAFLFLASGDTAKNKTKLDLSFGLGPAPLILIAEPS